MSQLILNECILSYVPKSCDLDPIHSKPLIECLYSIFTSLTDLFNSFLASGILPQFFKSALVTPILKKSCFDHNDKDNYRPVHALLLRCWKILSYPKFLPTTTHTILATLIVLVTALKQLFRKLFMICPFLL